MSPTETTESCAADSRKARPTRVHVGRAISIGVLSIGLLSLAGCGSNPPGSVDEEQIAVDLDACAAAAPSCIRQGDVTPVEALLPGDSHAVHIAKGGSIRAPLLRPSATAKLAYLAVAMHTIDSDSTTTPPTPSRIEVQIDGASATTLRPISGFNRAEIDMQQIVPGDAITIRCVEGALDLVYVVGRWDD